jgi:hypothetical protein
VILHPGEVGTNRGPDRYGAQVFTAARWRVLLSTLPWVLLLLGVTALRDDILKIDGLVEFSDIGAILTGAALIIGLMLAGVISDFKESERLPSELAATLETMGDAIQSAHAGGKAGDLSDLLHDYDDVSRRVEDWFLNENTSEDCYRAVEEITFLTARLEQSGAAAGYLGRLLSEQHNLRRTVARIDTIRTTSFIQPGYALLDLFVATVLVLLVMSNFRSQTLQYLVVGLLGLIYLYLARLVRDLDNPFDYAMGQPRSGAEVSPVPLLALQRRREASRHATLNAEVGDVAPKAADSG